MILYYLKKAYNSEHDLYLAKKFFKNKIENDEYFRNVYFSICRRLEKFTFNNHTNTFSQMSSNSKGYYYSFYYKDRFGYLNNRIVIKLLSNLIVYEIRMYDESHQLRILFIYNRNLSGDADFSTFTFGFDKKSKRGMSDTLDTLDPLIDPLDDSATDLLTDPLKDESAKVKCEITCSSGDWIGDRVDDA